MKIVATLPPMHPGEMLREEFLKPMDLTPYKVAKACGVPRTRIERIVREELGHYGGYRASPGEVLRHDGRVLDEPAEPDTTFASAERAIAADLAAIETFKREAA